MDQPASEDSLDDRLDDRLCVLLYRASHAMTAAYRTILEPLGLTYPQYTVLSALWQGGEDDRVPVKDLARVLASDYSTMSPLLKRLEAKGLIQRTRSSTDEREVLVRLLPAGRHLSTQAAAVQDRIRGATGLSEDQRSQLADDLHRLAEHLHDFAD